MQVKLTEQVKCKFTESFHDHTLSTFHIPHTTTTLTGNLSCKAKRCKPIKLIEIELYRSPYANKGCISITNREGNMYRKEETKASLNCQKLRKIKQDLNKDKYSFYFHFLYTIYSR